MSDSEKAKKDPEVKQKFVVRTPTDVQRIKLQKLMANPTKEVIIQPLQAKKSLDPSGAVPSFVRNVMGSSAGAGSGEFHVYRHLRRKEFARQKQIEQKSKVEEMDEAFANKLLQNKLDAESKTAKKRAKRLKKKQKAKQRRLNPKSTLTDDKLNSSEDESSDGDNGEAPSANAEDDSERKEGGIESCEEPTPKDTSIEDTGANESEDRQDTSNDSNDKEHQEKSDEKNTS